MNMMRPNRRHKTSRQNVNQRPQAGVASRWAQGLLKTTVPKEV